MKWEAQNPSEDKDKSSKHIRSPHDKVVSEVALIPIKQSAREEKSKQKDLAQTTVKKLEEHVEEMWSFRAVQYKDTVKRASCNFHSTDDSEPWIPTFFPRLNKTVGEKKLDPNVLFRWKAAFVHGSACCTTLELPELYTNTQPFIHSCWHRLDASSCTPMHVNTLLCGYSNVTLKRPSNDASGRRRAKSCWDAMPDLLYAQRSAWIIERQNQRYDKSDALKRWLHACTRGVEYIERRSLQHASQKHLGTAKIPKTWHE